MKRMRRTRRDTMADMESRRDLTRRDMDLQYLRKGEGWDGGWGRMGGMLGDWVRLTAAVC